MSESESKPKKRLPPNMCQPAKPDVELLEKFRDDENIVSITYVGTIRSGPDYRDLFLVYTKEAMLHILAVRRLCIGEKELEELVSLGLKEIGLNRI